MNDHYLKCHCGFKLTEMVWVRQKRGAEPIATEHIDIFRKALESVSISKIRKFFRKSYRYMDAYRITDFGGSSLTCRQIEYAVKKYRGHRIISVRILDLSFSIGKIKPPHKLALISNCGVFSNKIETHYRVCCPLLYIGESIRAIITVRWLWRGWKNRK